MIAFTLFVTLIILIALGAPIAIALVVGSSVALAFLLHLPLEVIAQRICSPALSVPLLAIPFFMLAGEIMTAIGVSEKLVAVARIFVGWVRGGLGHIAILTCTFFAGISGSGAADTAAVAAVMIPQMKKSGYEHGFSGALIAAAGALGVIIPPSILMIIYGSLAEVSIGDLFIAGIAPGILISLTLIIYTSWSAKNKVIETNIQIGDGKFSALMIILDGLPALLAPAIIVGGIYTGAFTPTESAIVAAGYAIMLGLIYRKLSFRMMLKCTRHATQMTAATMFVIMASDYFGWIAAYDLIPQSIGTLLIAISKNPYIIMLLLNILLLIVGTFFNTAAAIIIFTPIFVPALTEIGINLIYFGVVMVVNLAIGLITPPLGIDLFIVSGAGRINTNDIMEAVFPFIVILILDLALITYVPLIFGWGLT